MSIVHPALSSIVSISEEHGITDVEAEHLTYNWTIENFSLLPQENGEYIESPIFRTENKDVEWKIIFYPRGDREEAIGHTSVYLWLESVKAEKIEIQVHSQLIILKSNHIHVNKSFDRTYTAIIGWGYVNFTSRSALLNFSRPEDKFTIRAEIDMPKRVITEPLKITDPGVKAEHLTYKWTIKNFSLLPQENGEYIDSTIFGTENKDVEWKLRLYPGGQNNDSIGYTSVLLQLHSKKAEIVKIKVRAALSILISGNILANSTADYTYDEINGHGPAKFISRPNLLSLSGPDDTFTIRVDIDMPIKIIAESSNITDPLEQELLADLQTGQWKGRYSLLFKEEKFSDVVVVVANEKLSAHKIILATRSPVFAAMFEAEKSKENWSDEVKIEDMEPAVVKAMLEFIYTDEVTDLERLASGLFKAADRFQLSRLKNMCKMVLYRTVNVDNSADLLVLTDIYHSYKLKEHVMEFIVKHISAVMKTEGFRKMERKHPQLVVEVLHAVVDSNPKTNRSKQALQKLASLVTKTSLFSLESFLKRP